MLKLRYLFENYDLAKEALKHWAHDDHSLDEALSRFRISANAIYPFYHNNGIYFLRLAPTEEKLERNLIGELEFIQYLRKNNYPVMEPVASLSGKYLLRLNTQWGNYYACVYKGVDGVQIKNTDYSDNIMFIYGKTLGRLHSLSSQYTPATKKWAYTDVLDWIERVLLEYHAPDSMRSKLDAVKDNLLYLPQSNNCYGLVHYDFEPDNVFYDTVKKHCNVIDFDDGMYHWYAVDIEQVFGELSEALNHKELKRAKIEFIRGYKEEHAITQDDLTTLPIMRQFIDLFSYARLIRCVAETFDNEPDWLIGLRVKLNSHIKKFENQA